MFILLLMLPQASNQKLSLSIHVMNTQEIYDYLQSDEPISAKKARLHQYLLEQVEIRDQDPDTASMVAYDIAGLLSTRFASDLQQDDPYIETLHLASKLELPEDVRSDDTTWQAFDEQLSRLDA